MLNESVVNFTMLVVDDAIKENAGIQFMSGLAPKIKRTSTGKCCKWCDRLVGTYNYEDVRDTGNNVFRRHRHCRCTVEFITNGKRQNVHTKKWVKNGIEKNKKYDKINVDKVVSGHGTIPKIAEEGMVIDHIDENDKVNVRTFYGALGFKEKDIHTTNHGNPKKHPYGKSGEHAHDYTWDSEGKLKEKNNS